MSLVALLCIFSSISISFLRYGLHDMDYMPVCNILSEVHKVSKENTECTAHPFANVLGYCEVIILGVMFIITFLTSVLEIQVPDTWPTCDFVLMTATKSCLGWLQFRSRLSLKGPVTVR